MSQDPITPEEFKGYLELLGWTLERTARELGLGSAVSVWRYTTNGPSHRTPPGPVVATLRRHVDLHLRRRGL